MRRVYPNVVYTFKHFPTVSLDACVSFTLQRGVFHSYLCHVLKATAPFSLRLLCPSSISCGSVYIETSIASIGYWECIFAPTFGHFTTLLWKKYLLISFSHGIRSFFIQISYVYLKIFTSSLLIFIRCNQASVSMLRDYIRYRCAIEMHLIIRERCSHISRERACNAWCSPSLSQPRKAPRRVESFVDPLDSLFFFALSRNIYIWEDMINTPSLEPFSPRNLTTRGNQTVASHTTRTFQPARESSREGACSNSIIVVHLSICESSDVPDTYRVDGEI